MELVGEDDLRRPVVVHLSSATNFGHEQLLLFMRFRKSDARI